LTQVKGSGEMDVKSDVENFTPAAKPPAPAPVETAAKAPGTRSEGLVPAGEVLTEEIKNSRIIAKRLAESLFTAPHYNLTIEVTMDDAMKSRAIINNILIQKFLLMIWSKACAGIKETSKVNSQWKEEAITINHHVSIVAVAVEDGLVKTCIKVYRCNEFISNWKRQRSCWKSKKQKIITNRNGRKYFYLLT
jgi:pyruvate dehydrogenase E2 component (dihydrolipoamide acetyltransferase)